MPELPEVESVRRQLAPELTDRRILDVWWDPHPSARFSHVGAARGRRILAVARRGKFLLLTLDADPGGRDGELVLHLGMTGSLSFAATPGPRDDPHADVSHVRARFDLDDGRSLLFRDPRRFGRVSVVAAGDHLSIPTLAALGPEPLTDDFDPARFAAALAASDASVKARLLDQRLVAGVGNIYADEALWRAHVHPGARRLGPRRARRLHGALVEVLSEAIEREGTTFRDYRMVNGESGRNAAFLDVYGKAGRPCRRCGTTLRRTLVAQRGTTFCPVCQRR